MVKLDIRQESTRHSDVIDTITQYLGLGSYKYALSPHFVSACILDPSTACITTV
jgi:hypothetical protein